MSDRYTGIASLPAMSLPRCREGSEPGSPSTRECAQLRSWCVPACIGSAGMNRPRHTWSRIEHTEPAGQWKDWA